MGEIERWRQEIKEFQLPKLQYYHHIVILRKTNYLLLVPLTRSRIDGAIARGQLGAKKSVLHANRFLLLAWGQIPPSPYIHMYILHHHRRWLFLMWTYVECFKKGAAFSQKKGFSAGFYFPHNFPKNALIGHRNRRKDFWIGSFHIDGRRGTNFNFVGTFLRTC